DLMANNHGSLILSRAVDTEYFDSLAKNGIHEDMFVSEADKKAYRFIEQYVRENGQNPSYATLVHANEDLNYVPGLTHSFEYLAGNIRTRKAQIEFNELMSSSETSDLINDNKEDMEYVINYLVKNLESVRLRSVSNTRSARSLKDTDIFLEEYRKRQDGESFE